MDTLNVFANEDNQANVVKPPPRVCPRCYSDQTKFGYFNNYKTSQPRYKCKNCRRHWTHGGALRNIPIGGSCRKSKIPKIDQSSVSQMASVEIQPGNHQPLSENQENISVSAASSSAAIGNHFGYFSELHRVANLSPTRSFLTMDHLDFGDESFQQDLYDVGSNDLIGNPWINQSVVDMLIITTINASCNMNMNHRAKASRCGGSSDTEMNKIETCLFRSS